MLVLRSAIGLLGGWLTRITGGIGAAFLGHAMTRFAVFLSTGHAGQSRAAGTRGRGGRERQATARRAGAVIGVRARSSRDRWHADAEAARATSPRGRPVAPLRPRPVLRLALPVLRLRRLRRARRRAGRRTGSLRSSPRSRAELGLRADALDARRFAGGSAAARDASISAVGRRRCCRPRRSQASLALVRRALRARRRRRGHDRGEPGPGRARRRARRCRAPGSTAAVDRGPERSTRSSCAGSGAGTGPPMSPTPSGGARRRHRLDLPRPPVRRARPDRGVWRATPGRRARAAPDHLSLYALTLDDPDAEGLTGPTATTCRRGRARGAGGRRRSSEQDDDRAAAQYGLAADRLGGRRLRGYEIWNWARPGHESRHNLAYWTRQPYEAVGPGAHAFDGAVRRWNAARLDGYLAALAPPDGPRRRCRRVAASPSTMPRPKRRRRSSACAWIPACHWTRPRAGRWRRTSRGHSTPACSSRSRLAGARVRLTTRGRLLSNELFSRLV